MHIKEYTQKFLKGEKVNVLNSQQIVTNTSAPIIVHLMVHVIHNGETVGNGTNICLAQIQS